MSQKSAFVIALVIMTATTTIVAAPASAKSGYAVLNRSIDPIVLVGEWERYEGVFTDEGLASSGAKPRYVFVGTRRGFPAAAARDGYVTYRLRIKLDGESKANSRLVLLMSGIADVDAVFANGEPLYDGAVDARAPLAMAFDAQGDRVSIVLHCGPGGLRLEEPSLVPAFFILGGPDAIGGSLLAASIPLAAEAAVFLVVGILVLCLYFFWSKTPEFLAFAAAALASGFFFALEGGALFGLLPARLLGQARLEACIVAGVLVLLASYIAFFRSALRDRIPRPAAITAYAILAAMAAAAIALPPRAGLIAMIGAALAALCFLGLLALSVRLAAKGQARGYLIAAALFILAAALAAARALPQSFASAYLMGPAGLLALDFAVLLLLLKKAGNTLDTVESLSDYVESISRTVKSFIPREFLEYLDKADVTDLKLGDHARKKMTIFFSDIRSFTELSENLTVEENFAFINSYLSRVVPVIRENGGFVDKYVGDAIMALFGGESGPDRAIKSAIAMNAKIVEYNGHRAKMGYRPISMGVGVHTGELMLGVVGVSDRMENTVISDAVNLGSRLQAITKAFNISLAISEQAFKELEDPGVYKYRFIGKVKVKGKAEPVSVFEIFDGIEPDLFERKMRANMFFEQGMLCYYQKDFSGATYYFKRVIDIIPEDGASSFYLENCMSKTPS